MLNRSRLISAAVAVAFVVPHAFAENSSWLQDQLSMSDGFAPLTTVAGAQGRRGFSRSDSSWLEQQLSISDGYSLNEELSSAKRETGVYVGASLEQQREDFALQRMRISDGATE